MFNAEVKEIMLLIIIVLLTEILKNISCISNKEYYVSPGNMKK